MDRLSDFLSYARDRMLTTDEPLPCEPEDAAAVMGYLCALVPEYELDRQAVANADAARSADRKHAMLTGLRRARGAPAPEPPPEDEEEPAKSEVA